MYDYASRVLDEIDNYPISSALESFKKEFKASFEDNKWMDITSKEVQKILVHLIYQKLLIIKS